MSYGFEFCLPTKVVFGRDAHEKTGALVKECGGTKVLLHYGSGSVVRNGVLDLVKASLEAAGVPYAELGGVVPNPHLSKVYEGIDLCRKEGCDFILAVGGGSVIDSSKAIAYGLRCEGDVWDLFDHKATAADCAPVGVVLTIAASGSETSNSCVITNDLVEPHLKRWYDSEIARARFAVMNPEFTMTLPAYQTAAGCADIMMHTMERYFTNGGSLEITDALCEALLRTVKDAALKLVEDPDDYETRAAVMWAGSLSHDGLMGCGCVGGDGVCHNLEHEVGALFGVTHGAGLCALWCHWARYVHSECMYKFKRFAVKVMGVADTGDDERTVLAGIDAMEEFFRAIGMPTNLRELGVEPTEEEIRQMARMCVASNAPEIGSAKVFHEEDMVRVYQAARGE